MESIKLSEAAVCDLIYTSQKFRVQTDYKLWLNLFRFLRGKAIAERKKGNIQTSNKFIDYSASLWNIYSCTFQCAKKYRKAFNIKEIEK